jgi:hypothetical protein
MARAISAWGEWNPYAIRVMSRTLASTDSVRPLEQTVLDGGVDGVAVAHDAS